MKISKKRLKHLSLMALILLTGTSATTFAANKTGESNLSGNITATSTYVWRGVPLTSDAAIQGGIDYSLPVGFHVGAWTSNVSNRVNSGSELDITVGFAGAAKGLSYDAGLIVYLYPQYEAAAAPGQDFNFNEFYAGISRDMLTARIFISPEAGNYIEVNANFEKLVAGWDLGLHMGSYDVDKDFYGPGSEDYIDTSVSLGSKMNGLDVSFALSNTNLDDDSFRTIITVSKAFTP
jgi:uncharacterized protein (TIGR02001 family)